MLRERHGAGVKPAVNDFWNAGHFAAALGAFQLYRVNIGAMEFDFVRAAYSHAAQFFDATDAMPVPAGAFPNIEWGAPVPIAADAPVLHIFQPVSKATFSDRFGDPVDRFIVSHETVFYRGHFDKPAISCVVNQRRIAAPAVGIAMLE